MARIDHRKTNVAEHLRRRGIDNIADDNLPAEFRRPARKGPSKAALRSEAEAAMADITRVIKCPCGHSAEIALPASWAGRRLRCSRCGEIAK